jgi:uncharacterized membrane protein YphA (DoxX/SURF4 family)
VYDVLEQRAPRSARSSPVAGWTLRIATGAALAVDAWVHWDLVARYDANIGPSSLSQGDLFRIEAVVSALVAVLLLVSGRWLVWVAAWLVAASAVAAVLLYRYHDPGPLGPLPDMYEPLWFREKTIAFVAEGVAVVTASFGLVEVWWRRRRREG